MRKIICPTKSLSMLMRPACESTEFTVYLAKNDVTMLQCNSCGVRYDLDSLKKKARSSK